MKILNKLFGKKVESADDDRVFCNTAYRSMRVNGKYPYQCILPHNHKDVAHLHVSEKSDITWYERDGDTYTISANFR